MTPVRSRWRLALFGVLALCVLASAGTPQQRPAAMPDGMAVIEVLDVGQGDAILIRSPEGPAALVDAGPSSKVLERLRERGVDRLDLVVVTHHHTDHYGGMDDIIRAYKPRYFLATNSKHTTSMYLKLLEDVKREQVTAITPKPDGPRKISLGSVTLTVLPQPPENLDEENNNSIGIRVTFGNLSVLLTGDSEDEERAWWLKNCPDLVRDCKVLKLAHHGSHNGTDPHWLEIVNPRVAVASLAAGNSYGHPHKQTLALLQEYEIPLLRTDERGTIRIESDGKKTIISGSKRAMLTAQSNSLPASRTSSGTRPSTKGSGVSLAFVNSASRRELERTLGVDSSVSRAIVSGRPYQSLDEVEEAAGILRARLAASPDRAVVR